jgi:hypothetical protein
MTQLRAEANHQFRKMPAQEVMQTRNAIANLMNKPDEQTCNNLDNGRTFASKTRLRKRKRWGSSMQARQMET